MATVLRDNIFLLGSSTHQIYGNRLPTNSQVLKVFYFNTRHVKLNYKDSIKLVIQEVQIFWEKSGIPTQDFHNSCRKLEKLYENHRSVQKHAGVKSNQRHEEEFTKKLKMLFDIARLDVLNELDEDKKNFLLNQRSASPSKYIADILPEFPEGQGTKSVNDTFQDVQADILMGLMNENQNAMQIPYQGERLENYPKERVTRITEQLDQLTPPSQEQPFLDIQSTESSIESQKQQSSSSEFDCEGRHYVSKGIRGSIKILTPELVASLDYCKLSYRSSVRIIIATIEALVSVFSLDIDIKDIVINKTSFNEIRSQIRKENAEKIKMLFGNEVLEAVVLHWDGKLIEDLVKSKKVDRVPIIITNGDIEKILDIPPLENSKGITQAHAMYQAVISWGVEDNIKALCCDTTNSNMGCKAGAAYLFQKLINRDLSFFACRHHVYELVLKAVFELKLPGTDSPNVPLFKKFREAFPGIDKNSYRLPNESDIHPMLAQEKESIANLMKAYLQINSPRDDYKELLILCLIYLGEIPAESVKFYKPGAFHHARWMAKAIYSLKILLFRDQFPLKDVEIKALEDLCQFIVFVYTPAWFKAPLAIEAPKNDLDFIKKLYLYESVDETIAKAALHKFVNHLWYLAPENCALSLYDSNVSIDTKRKMVQALKFDQNFESISPKRLIIKNENELEKLHEKELSDFISAQSIKFLDRFNLNKDFLAKDPETWSQDPHYLKGREIVKKLKVVNDVAERGVKHAENYINILTKDESQKQYLIQEAEAYIKDFPKCTKTSISKRFRKS